MLQLKYITTYILHANTNCYTYMYKLRNRHLHVLRIGGHFDSQKLSLASNYTTQHLLCMQCFVCAKQVMMLEPFASTKYSIFLTVLTTQRHSPNACVTVLRINHPAQQYSQQRCFIHTSSAVCTTQRCMWTISIPTCVMQYVQCSTTLLTLWG